MRVIVEPKAAQEEDIFQPGKLVVSTDGKWIVLVSHDRVNDPESYFTGTAIKPDPDCYRNRYGDHCTAWPKNEFTKFVGKIILEQ